jgi:phospholipid/cholesterol/gamma-HCH transport system substrate-binding protein
MQREIRVGLLTLTALVVLAIGIFVVGDRQQLFARTSDYKIRFDSTSGLSRGAQVQLSGVNVGQVTGVELPLMVSAQGITVSITVERQFEEHIREDSLARIKTLGLLGDKYIEISAGSSEAARIPAGGEIPAAPATDVDKLIASGEDLVENVVAMSVSLRTILARMERGEGLLGELVTSGEEGAGEVRRSLDSTLASIDSLVAKIDRGEGSLGVLINEPDLVTRVTSAVERLEATVAAFEGGEGILPALLHDAELRDRFTGLLGNLETTTGSLDSLVVELREGEGLLNKLLTDEAYAAKVSGDLERLIENLRLVSEKLNSGEGTVAQLLNDPAVYEAVNDILVGVDNSKFLRWLIRNRQKSGIEERYHDEVEEMEDQGIEPPPLDEPPGAGSGR